MNSQVLIDRKFLQDLLFLLQQPRTTIDARAVLVFGIERALATPAPIPDAGGEVLTPALRQYLHNDGSGLVAGYDLELTQRIVSALQASAMVVPDEWRELLEEMAASIRNSYMVSSEGEKFLIRIDAMLAASTAPGDSQ